MAFADFFSPVAFFICLRETLEAGIIIAVLLGFIKQLVPSLPSSNPDHIGSSTELLSDVDHSDNYGTPQLSESAQPRPKSGGLGRDVVDKVHNRERMVRSMRTQIWTGAVLGGLIAALIGAVFLFVFYTYTHDLWQDAENLWEGGFSAIASILILVMGLAFLRLPHAQTKWRLKLLSAYQHHQHHAIDDSTPGENDGDGAVQRLRHRRTQGGKMILFGLPFITVLREGLEGVVFLGGIGLSEAPPAVAGGAIVGLIVGGFIAYMLFSSTTPLPLRTFTTLSTLLLFLIGAGLASRAAYSLERQGFINGVGTAAAESGTGPGSYRVAGNIWKLDYGDPEPGAEDGGGFAQLAQSIVGWNNVGTIWTVGTYIVYWWAIIGMLGGMKWKEGRAEVCGTKSKRGWQRELAKRRADGRDGEEEGLLGNRSGVHSS